MPGFYEFFAGGGMVRAGLGPQWSCLFANDLDPRKAEAYRANWGEGGELRVCDVAEVRLADLPGRADLVWGSFPCQDLSLAGPGAGLEGGRSGSFYPFWRLIEGLVEEGRAPVLVAIENVCGTLTSHGGRDFQAICSSFARAGYRFGALVINAELFVPQSRPRLFVVGVREDLSLEPRLLWPEPREPFHPHALRRAVAALPQEVREKRVWWRLPTPEPRESSLSDLIEDSPNSVRWHTREETERLLALMSKTNLAKVEAARRSIRRRVGCVYRRTRRDERGERLQRAEVRFDEVAGCLRTPAGGSSRQAILVVEGAQVRSRLISARETARLMGLPDSYELPEVYNDAYHLTGDGVVVDVVAHLARHLFEPVLEDARTGEQQAA
jgi:DNA (cytosine-5)-methyltransferase 1